MGLGLGLGAVLTLNYVNQKNIWNQMLVKSCIPIREKHLHRKPYKAAKDIRIRPLNTKREKWWCYWKNTKVSLHEKHV